MNKYQIEKFISAKACEIEGYFGKNLNPLKRNNLELRLYEIFEKGQNSIREEIKSILQIEESGG